MAPPFSQPRKIDIAIGGSLWQRSFYSAWKTISRVNCRGFSGSTSTTSNSRIPWKISAAFQRDVDIVFAGGDGPDYREVVGRLTALRPGLRVVLVNRLPENARWLDALELGAADYCGAPFESLQMRWLVDSVLRHPYRRLTVCPRIFGDRVRNA